jgi:hypothetical protein
MVQKLRNKKLDKLKEEADKEIDYQGGGAYKAFLKLFSNNIIEERQVVVSYYYYLVVQV